jgi:hypothetical protein
VRQPLPHQCPSAAREPRHSQPFDLAKPVKVGHGLCCVMKRHSHPFCNASEQLRRRPRELPKSITTDSGAAQMGNGLANAVRPENPPSLADLREHYDS